MNTFVKIFSAEGCNGDERIENSINKTAKQRNLDIVSASSCFRKGTLGGDVMFVVVVFRRADDEQRKAD